MKQANAGPADRRWLDLCVKASVLAKLQTDLGRLRAAVTELRRTYADKYPAAELQGQLDDYQRRLVQQAAGRLDPADPLTHGLMAELPGMQHRMLVELNPALRGAEIVFVKRFTYDSKHFYDDFQHVRRWGGELCVLSLGDGHVRPIVSGVDRKKGTGRNYRNSPKGAAQSGPVPFFR